MLFVTKPEINLFAGWRYLLDRSYRQATNEEWQSEPGWVVAMQMAAGACSVLFPLIIIGLLAFVYISRRF